MWYKQEDVLNDLAKFSGNRQMYLDRNFVVVGQNPPPPRYMEENDDEFMLQFGHNAREISDVKEVTPDLHGIKEMLKLVNEQNCTDDNQLESKLELNPCSTIVISKLNPNVKEFIPKFTQMPPQANITETNDKVSNKQGADKRSKETHSNGKLADSRDIGSGICNTNDKEEKSSHENCINKDSKSNNNNNKCLSETEFKNIAEALKTKISDAARSKSYQVKREKNMAICSLLKLYTEYPVIKNNTIKLMTPDDFTVTDNKKQVSKSETDVLNTVLSNENNNDVKEKAGVDSCNELKSTNNSTEQIDDETKEKINNLENNRDVQRSIEKVTNWLEPKKETKKPALHLGPVMFKRKATNKSPVSDNQIRRKPEPTYKPSAYADDLVKKYTENKKIRETKELKPTWDNLEHILKKKDEEIKKKNAIKNCNSANEHDNRDV